MNVVLAAASSPISREHLQKTVIEGVNVNDVKGLIREELLAKLLKHDKKIRVWGLVKGKNNDLYWNKIAEDDVILFHVDKKYRVYSKVLDKEINSNLAKKLWEPDKRTGLYYDRIIYLKNVQQIDLPISKINNLFGYDENFFPSHNVAFFTVQKEKLENIISKYGSFEMAIGLKPQRISPINVRGILNQLCEQELEHSNIIKTAFAHLIAGKNIVFYGAPATSKTYLAKKICETICGEKNFSIETANAEWSHFDIIGGKTTDGFKEGIVLKAIKECEKAIDSNGRPYWLIIDELNRANLDLAFGEIFTQLDIEYREKPLKPYGENDNGYFVPFSFRIIATMNTYDRSLLFSLGYAFMRRFAFIQVESLFKHTKEKKEKEELKVPDDVKSIISNDRIKRIKEMVLSSTLKHFSTKKGEDKAFLFEDFELTSDQLEKILNQLKVNDLDIIDLLNYISYKITNEGLVEIGHAMVFDATKFAVAYYLLFPEEVNIRMLLDEAVSAYLLPQLEYFMPKLRKGKIFGEKEMIESWNNVKRIFETLNLPSTLKRLNEAEKEFRVI